MKKCWDSKKNHPVIRDGCTAGNIVLFRVNDDGAATAMALFGFSTILNGYLIFRSGFMPRWLGAMGGLSGLGWLTFLYPPFGRGSFMITAIVGLATSAIMIFWLLAMGVKEDNRQS